MKEYKEYRIVSKINHWLTAVVFIGMIGLGFYLEYGGLERESKGFFMGIHKSIGVLFLAFAFWRLGWRLLKGFPQTVANTPNWQQLAAKVTHWVLLLAIITMPVSGLIMSLYGGRNIEVFDWFVIPAQEKNELINSIAHGIHFYAAFAIVAVLVLHIGAALKHHYIDKDVTLKRML